MLIFKTLF